MAEQGRRRFRSVRALSTIGAVTVVAVALAVSAVVFIGILERELGSQLDQTLQEQVADRVALLDDGADPQALLDLDRPESVAWIGTPQGQPLAVAGYELIEIPAVAPGSVATVDALIEEDSHPEPEREQVRLAAGATRDGQILVFIGLETSSIEATLGTAARSMLVGIPVLVVLTGLAVWFALGRALDPVERIRSQAAAISGDALDQRVPVTGTGDEIDRLAHTVNDMLSRLASHDEAQRRFASDASHELKSPTANIKVLAETATTDNWESTRDHIATEADRLGAIVDDLLFLNVSSEHSTGGTHQHLDLDDIVFDEAELLARRTELRVDVGSVTPTQIVGAAPELRRAVRNLADNAARHAAGEVRFELTRGAQVELAVIDDGPGIPDADKSRVAERFTRLDTARDRVDGGTGLGLAIVADIAARHGGRLEVADAPGGGTRMVLLLEG